MLKRITYSLLLAPAIVGASLIVTGCDTQQGPVEKAGEAIDEAAQDAQDSMEEAGEEVRDEIDDATTD
jgi:predicted small secreted protein